MLLVLCTTYVADFVYTPANTYLRVCVCLSGRDEAVNGAYKSVVSCFAKLKHSKGTPTHFNARTFKILYSYTALNLFSYPLCEKYF